MRIKLNSGYQRAELHTVLNSGHHYRAEYLPFAQRLADAHNAQHQQQANMFTTARRILNEMRAEA